MSQQDKPWLALNNITAGVRERQDANRTREAGHLDEIQGIVATVLDLFRNGTSLLAKVFGLGFIDLVRRNFMATLPEKRDDEEGNTYQRGVPENKRTQQSISGRRSEQIS